MAAMLIRERYKVIRVLEARTHYAFAEAVDLLDREQGLRLLNLYEGPLLRTYLADFDRMDACGSFVELFVTGQTLVSVFTPVGGEPIDQVFFQGDGHHWRTRMHYAGALFQQALELVDLPPAVSCAALCGENVRIDLTGERVCLRYQVLPMEGMDGRELAWLAADQIKKILRPQASSPVELLDFLEELERVAGSSVVELYRLWRSWYGPLYNAYEDLEGRSFFLRWWHLARSRAGRWLKRRKRRETGG